MDRLIGHPVGQLAAPGHAFGGRRWRQPVGLLGDEEGNEFRGPAERAVQAVSGPDRFDDGLALYAGPGKDRNVAVAGWDINCTQTGPLHRLPECDQPV